LYDVRTGNGAVLFLQHWSPHWAFGLTMPGDECLQVIAENMK